jgi:hypothetical protein
MAVLQTRPVSLAAVAQQIAAKALSPGPNIQKWTEGHRAKTRATPGWMVGQPFGQHHYFLKTGTVAKSALPFHMLLMTK